MKLDNETKEDLISIIMKRIDFLTKRGKEINEEVVNHVIKLEFNSYDGEYDDTDVENIRLEIAYYTQIKHTFESVIYDDYDDSHNWYKNENGEFWKLYRRYLEAKGSLDINSINKLEQDTLPALMNCLGNPNGKVKKKLRRGLVIGDVQSGKTATYTGLICKAADAGYKVVILLTGLTEALRKQTQERMEEGIIGYTIRKISCGNSKSTHTERVGVGKYPHDLTATAFTSYDDDFKANKQTIATSLKSHKSIVMFIIKKNVKILENLYSWLEAFNKDVLDDMIHAPMLLIDDEADNASINTRKDKYNPTTTNREIRKLCNAFNNATYVGFTATPFANVFIDPDTTSEMVNADLFPEDFIYVLPTPDTYIGTSKLFAVGEPLREQCLKFIHDIEEPTKEELEGDTAPDNRPLYYKHSKNWHGTFPQSFTDSIRCFYLANVIRDLRGDINKPRTMMINISRFIKVHKHTVSFVKELYDRDYGCILTDFDDKQIENHELNLYKELERLFKKHYIKCGFTVKEVLSKENLINAIKHILILSVNSKKGSDKLDYKNRPNLRSIAIGGLSLSRGLTLEGLIVSYFYRNTATFDVLMQMGRWFGYRHHYEDICQIWTTETSANWYSQIADSTEELKLDLRCMYDDKMTPKQFGIKVHDISDDLQITSSNKMYNTFNHEIFVEFWGGYFETPYVNLNVDNNNTNLELVNTLLNNILKDGDKTILPIQNHEYGSILYKSVPRLYINPLIENIRVSYHNMKFFHTEMREFLADTRDKKLDYWDVVIFGNSKGTKEYPINGKKIREISRTVKLLGGDSSGKFIGFTGSAGRLGSKSDGYFAISDEEVKIEKALEKYRIYNELSNKPKRSDIDQKSWFKFIPDRNPCLMIYIVNPKDESWIDNQDMKDYHKALGENPIVGFGVGFPSIGDNSIKPKSYKVNKIYWKQLLEESGEEDELA